MFYLILSLCIYIYISICSAYTEKMDFALYFEKYPRRVTQDRNEVLDHEAHNGKNSTAGDEDLNIKKKYTKLKLVLKELNKEHKAVCDQRDELNDLLGQMMHKKLGSR